MADLLATGPFVHPNKGIMPRRITLAVIRAEDGTPVTFVTQMQGVDEDGGVVIINEGRRFVLDADPLDVQRQAWEEFREWVDYEVRSFPLADLTAPRFTDHLPNLTINMREV